MEQLASLLPFALIIGFSWLFLVRPARQRQRQQEQVFRSLKVDDQVVTTSGIYGRIVSVEDDRIVLEVSPTVNLTMARRAIMSITPTLEPATTEGEK